MGFKRFWQLASLSLLILTLFVIFNGDQVGESPAVYKQREIQRKHNRIKKSIKKYNRPDKYYEYQSGIRNNPNSTSKKYPGAYQIKELEKARNRPEYKIKSSLRTQGLEFKERGPANVPGRTRSLIALPDDPEVHWLAGAVGGGIWETTNAGASWENKTKDMPSLAVSCMANCKSNQDVIYAGTGEGYFNIDGLGGVGILKSIDGGSTWSILESTLFDDMFAVVTRIVVDHTNPDIVLASTYSAGGSGLTNSLIVKSIDGGVNWDIVYQSNYQITQIISNPENPSTLFASYYNFNSSGSFQSDQVILKSIDGGENWFPSGQGINSVNGRIEMAIAPSDTSIIYASAEGNLSGSGADLFVSKDAGLNWQLVNQTFDERTVDFLDGQGWFDNTIEVNPFDELEVFYGGVNLWKTKIGTGSTTEYRHVIDVTFYQEENTMWSLVNFGADYYNGRIELDTTLEINKFVDIAIVTGPDVVQKAYRFIVNKQGAGVPDEGYLYQDYVNVPFQVWDMTNDRQLMVSYRDQQEDGIFQLLLQNTEAGQESLHSREYIYIHALEYSETENGLISQDGGKNRGHTHENMYFMWPVLSNGLIWDEVKNNPDTFLIDYEFVESFVIDGEMTNISDAYLNYSSINTLEGDFPEPFHPDHHKLLMIPVDSNEKSFKILNANDGGVFVSNTSSSPGVNNKDWTFSGYGYNTGQFYSAAKQPGAEVFIGGLQDNGTWKSSDNEAAAFDSDYEFQVGGDGFDVIWHAIRPRQIIASSQFNTFYRTKDGGSNWERVDQGIEGVKPFLSKLSNSNSNPDVLFTVTSEGVYKSPNFGSDWILTSIDEGWDFSNYTRVEVSLANPNIIWAGGGMSDGRKIHVSANGGATYKIVNNFNDESFSVISGMATHPFEDSTAYVLFSYPKGSKILRTEDLGASWEDISGFNGNETSSNGFPDVAVFSLLLRPDEPNIIWAGTEIGIFESANNGESWNFLDNDMGAASIWDMNVMDDQVVIATHGRGIYTATLTEAYEVVIVPEIIAAGTTVKGDFIISFDFKSAYDSSIISLNGISEKIFAGTEKGIYTGTFVFLPANDSIKVELSCFRKGKEYVADPLLSSHFEVGDPVEIYIQDFNSGTDDFTGNGFDVIEYSGFDDIAIHSTHPYEEGENFTENNISYIFNLKLPIIVSNRNPRVEYEDVALIEIGEIGSRYPQQDFYDYVVFEGSTDGLNWRAIGDGYDAKKDQKWETAFGQGLDGDKSMFVKHSVILSNYFAANDTILLRFRLFSDPLNVGWGWVIDNLSVQPPITGIDKFNELEEDMLSVYPNPTSNLTTLDYTIQKESSVEVFMMDISGNMVFQEQLGIKKKGDYDYQINASSLRQGIYIIQLRIDDSMIIRKLLVN